MKRYLVLIFVLSIISVWPFLQKGFFKSDDGEWMIVRFTAFHQSLADGQFPVRFTKRLNNNYGYPVFNFLYPSPFYISEFPKILGFSFINSIKITFIISALGSSLLMFWALSKKFNEPASISGALIYLYAPYRFIDMYSRGSLGECVSFLAPPIILATIYTLKKGEEKLLPLLSFSVGFLILSHNVSAALFLPTLTGYAFSILNKSKFFQYLKYTILGVAISAFFSVPALLELHFVRLSQIKISLASAHLISLPNLIGWPVNTVLNQAKNEFTGGIGVMSIIILTLGLLGLFAKKNNSSATKYSLCIILISIFLVTQQSRILWDLVPGIDIIQFPWRLLMIVVLFTSILVTQLVHSINKVWPAVLIIVIAIISTISYTKDLSRTMYEDNYYSTNEDTTTVKDEYLPIWVQEKPARVYTATVPNQDIYIMSEQTNGLKYTATVRALNDTIMTLNTVYYPGFKAKINSKVTEIKYQNKNGLMSVELPKGDHEVIIYFGKSPVHLISELISIFGICAALFMFYKKWQK